MYVFSSDLLTVEVEMLLRIISICRALPLVENIACTSISKYRGLKRGSGERLIN